MGMMKSQGQAPQQISAKSISSTMEQVENSSVMQQRMLDLEQSIQVLRTFK